MGRPRIPWAADFPRIARQWHPTKNGALRPRDVARTSKRRVWWKCNKGPDHEWQATIDQRTRPESRGRCPFCSGRRASVTNSLARRYPELAAEWHATNNGKLTPNDVTPTSNRRVWWKCTARRGHVWRTSVAARLQGTGCPFCGGLRASMDHNLKVLHPAVAKLWDLRKNQGKKPDSVRPGSKQLIWWRCLRNRRHVWRSRVSEAVLRPGCPHCGREPTPPPQRGENGPSYTGVRFSREAGLYIASLRRDGRRVELGGWKRARDAAIARDRAALFLEANVRLHIPGMSRKLGPASPEKLRRLARQSNQPKVTGAERFRGITRIPSGRWAVQLCVNNVVYTSSGYESARAAAIAYDRLALHYAGPGWPRNFPARKLEPASFQELRRESVERRLRRRVNQAPKRTAFVGVYHRSDSQYLPWVALLPHSSVPSPSTSYYLGHYATAEEASRARDRAALYYVGRDAYLNHPDELDSLEPADAATLRAAARRAAQERKAARTKAVRAV